MEPLQSTAPEARLEMLMQSYQDGDFNAAAILIDCVSPRLHRFFTAHPSSRTSADDLLQETWLRVHKARHTYRSTDPALPWFYAIARHVRVDHYRKATRTSAIELGWEAMSDQEPAAPAMPHRSLDVDSLLAPLSDSQREVIAMLKVAGMSLQEVASATSSTVGSVKQKVHRAYKTLRKTMDTLGLRQNQPEDIRE